MQIGLRQAGKAQNMQFLQKLQLRQAFFCTYWQTFLKWTLLLKLMPQWNYVTNLDTLQMRVKTSHSVIQWSKHILYLLGLIYQSFNRVCEWLPSQAELFFLPEFFKSFYVLECVCWSPVKCKMRSGHTPFAHCNTKKQTKKLKGTECWGN